ncbi:MAG TPA: hypothetical protein VNH22_12390 [Blastocatellia bacterium]|nr:hypothetical protein [Blastocatellia bacterium]
MTEQILTWLIPILLIVAMFWAIIHENTRKRKRTVQEYEKEMAETKNSLTRAGMLELDKFMGDSKSKSAAIEYRLDEEQGTTKTGSKGDDADRTEGNR